MFIIISLTKLYNTQYITLTSKSFIIELADGLEISFEREIWFSEEINIERGYKLVNKFSPISTITEGWCSPYAMICERKIINYKKKNCWTQNPAVFKREVFQSSRRIRSSLSESLNTLNNSFKSISFFVVSSKHLCSLVNNPFKHS